MKKTLDFFRFLSKLFFPKFELLYSRGDLSEGAAYLQLLTVQLLGVEKLV